MAHYRILDPSTLTEFVLGKLNRRRRGKQPRKTARLMVEQLEDRTVPATFIVNSLADTHAVDLIAGVDATGQVSLRSAIEAANHLGGDEAIQFDPGVFATPQTIVLTRGVLDLKDFSPGAITIQGPDGGVTISGNHASGVFRVAAKSTAELDNLTIRAGKNTGNGGGINNAGTLTIRNSTVTGNTAIIYSSRHGIGIYCYFGSGGGIFNKGSLTIDDSTISGNAAQWNGAGLYNALGAKLNINNSTISGNTKIASPYIYSSYGGGIDNLGAAKITNSTISGNRATAEGGGVYNNGTVDLLDCTITGNSAGSYGGGVCGTDGATTDLDRCTVSGNSARSGGGIAIPTPYTGDAEPLALNNCTISGNNASQWGGGVYIGWGNEATVTNCTISGNTAYNGGGFYNDNEETTIRNTIIAGNTSKSGNGDLVGFVLPASSNNLIGDGKGITGGIHNNLRGNLVGTHVAPINPLLAPLGYYGGATQTMPLLPGSLAIDAGSNAAIPAGVSTDQRGQPRIVNSIVDIGAVESPLAFLPAPTSLTPAASVIEPGAGYDKPTFTWSAVDGADHYELIVIDNNTGKTPIDVSNIGGVTYAASAANALTPGHSFTTYVVALNADNTEYCSAAQSFALAALPAATDLTPSGMVAASAGYDQPVFAWNDAGADHFSLKVVDITTHTTPIVVANISGTSYAATTAQSLTPGHSFIMCVTAFSTNGKAKSVATQSFTLAKLTAPTGITPTGIVAASAGYDVPVFNWNPVPGADHYNLVVMDNTTGAMPIIVRNLGAASYTATITQALTPGHKFTIRVVALSTNSKAYTFATQMFTLAPLTAPTFLLSISSDATGPLSFTWSAAAGAGHYNLYLVDNTAGATVKKYGNISDSSFTPSTPLVAGHKYTWWVAAVSTNGLSMIRSKSQAFTFIGALPGT